MKKPAFLLPMLVVSLLVSCATEQTKKQFIITVNSHNLLSFKTLDNKELNTVRLNKGRAFTFKMEVTDLGYSVPALLNIKINNENIPYTISRGIDNKKAEIRIDGKYINGNVTISGSAMGVTYDLLWNTEIKRLNSNIVVDSRKDGITTIHKEIDGEIENDLNILVFTDLHFDHKQELGNYAYTAMAKNIMNVKPDLVLFCGDNVTSIVNEDRAKQFAQLMEDLNVYWSFILGNHEGSEYPKKPMMQRNEMVKLFCEYPHCLADPSVKKTSDGKVVWGEGNHAINILNSKKKVAQTIFFLDSGVKMSEHDMSEEGYREEIEQFINMGKSKIGNDEFYDYIKDSQVKWYEEVMAKYPESNSIVFSHVPIKDMEDAYLAYYNKYIQAKGLRDTYIGVGIDNRYIWPYTSSTEKFENFDITMLAGRRAEDMCYSPHDLRSINYHTPIYNAMIKSGGRHPAFFCGHDHQNDFLLEEIVTQENNERKPITMGYIEPGCYSSNNFWTKGLLGKLPIIDIHKYHLIQGYTTIDLNLDNPNPFTAIEQHTNFDAWHEQHYRDALKLIEKSKGGKYHPAIESYPFDPNNPYKK